VIQYSSPFQFFTCDEALPNERINQLIALFDNVQSWEVHDSFYKASIADVTAHINPCFLHSLTDKIASITGAELSGHVEVKIQKMTKGQFARVHTDRPLLGFESVRLVVQLNKGWSMERDGGALMVHTNNTEESVTMRLSPTKNRCFGFVMTPAAHHSVQVTNRERRSAVFYFWHVGNTIEISEWVRRQLAEMSFADLPGYLSKEISTAEENEGEDVTFRAATVAWLLNKWECDEHTVTDGYRSALGIQTTPLSNEALIAIWVYTISNESFDISKWRSIRQILTTGDKSTNIKVQEAIQQCFPR